MNLRLSLLVIFSFILRLQAYSFNIDYLGIENGLSNNYIMSITQDKKGFMWFATESGLNRFDGHKFRVYKKSYDNIDKSISGNELNKVYSDKFDDVIWIGTQREGLNLFDCKTETYTYFRHQHNDKNSIITNDITDITNSADGNLWISTYSHGVEYFDKKKRIFVHYDSLMVPDLVRDGAWTIKDDEKGNLYIGHVNEGLSILSIKEKTVINYKYDPANPYSLPGNTVLDICIDKNGYIWVGTNNGLALFNPEHNNFTVFKHSDKREGSLAGNFIYCIEQMSDDKIFIGSENGGISILNIRQNIFQSPNEILFKNITDNGTVSGLSNTTVRSIFQDSFNNIWIGTYGGGINIINNIPSFFNVWAYSPIPNVKNKLNNKIAWGICADENDNLWIGTDGGGINYFENGVNKSILNKEKGNISDNAILSAIRDSKGNLWFGTYEGGVNVFDYKNRKFIPNIIPLFKRTDIRCFFEDKQNNMWIGTGDGLYVYNAVNKTSRHFTKDSIPIHDNTVRAFCQDKERNYWIGTFGQGLSILSPKMELRNHYFTDSSFCSNMVNYIFRDKKDQMWIATSEGLVLFPDSRSTCKYKVFTEKDGIIDNYIRAITNDADNNIWISTNNGISRFVPDQNKFFNYNHSAGVPIGSFMSGSVTKTSDGYIYFGSQNGVCYFNPSNIPTNQSTSPVAITGFYIYDSQIESPGKENSVPIEKKITLSYKQNTFSISFNTLNYAQKDITEYSYMLYGMDNKWNNTQGENVITFRNIPFGEYEFKVKSRLLNQEWSDNIASVKIIIYPPFWLAWWAKIIYTFIAVAIVYSIIRFYKRKLDLESSLVLEKKNHIQEQELNDERLRFYTNITHELRTPLTLILGPLDDMQNDPTLTEKQQSRISVIRRSANRLLRLINQILEFRKTETQNKKLSVEKGDIATLVKEIGLKYKELNISKMIGIDIKIETNNTVIYYDSDIISTILENLISNAIKYTHKGKVCIILKDVIENGINYTEIKVQDTGEGIQQEYLPRIFDRYYQVKDRNHVSGTGIGLAIVQNLVKIHQGTISVESEQGKGTTFSFRIRTNSEYPDAIHVNTNLNEPEIIITETKENKDNIRDKKIILVVEDDDEILSYIKDSLSDYYKVLTTNNGAKGFELAISNIPDIIISDIMMPIMDGIEFCKKIKKDIRTSHIPVILLTAKDTIHDRTEGYKTGAESYIVKPFNSALLHSRITNLLDSRKKTAKLVNENTAKKSTLLIESISKIDNEFIEDITSIIEQNLDAEKIDVNFIADKMNMSHSTLYRKIKALTGMTINEFIRKVRVCNAEKFLLTGKYTISEVSYMIGMNSLTYFRQCFKDEYGLPPSEYIKYILSKNNNEKPAND